MPNKNTLFAPCLTSSFKTSFKLSFSGRDDLGERDTVQWTFIDIYHSVLPYQSFCPSQSKTVSCKRMASARYEQQQTFLNTFSFRMQCHINQLKYLIPSPVESTKSVRLRWGIDSFWNHPIEKKSSYQCIGNCQNNANLFIAHLPKTYDHFVEVWVTLFDFQGN